MKTNEEIAYIFEIISNILEIIGENPFKSRAYRNAAGTIRDMETDLEDLTAKQKLTEIKGVGKDLADKINEYITTGSLTYYDELKAKVPGEFLDLLSIRGIGTKFLSNMFVSHNIRSLKQLDNLLNSEKALGIRGLGNKKINELKTNIAHYKQNIGRINIGIALPLAELLVSEIKRLSPDSRPTIAGSVRRMKETVRNINLLCIKDGKIDITDGLSKLDIISSVSKKEESFAEFRTEKDIEFTLTYCVDSSYGSTLLYLTGSRKHNDKLNKIAADSGFLLNKNGLFRDGIRIAGSNESHIYRELGADYIQPELREDIEEIELSLSGRLPSTVELSDIRGDLHTHSTWSDGRSSVNQMIMAAIEMGYEYIAITDHSPSSKIANGLDIKRLMQKKKEIEEIDSSTDRIKVLMGAEVDIRKDGSLDYPDDILHELDLVIASVHSNFNMSNEDMTRRIIKALKNPLVHILGHPTGRLVGERRAYEVDMDAVIDTAYDLGKALEINSSYKRLDLKDTHVKKAIKKGVELVISTDAHNTNQLSNIRYGVATARRGFATKKDILNTVDVGKITTWLKELKPK